MPVTLLYEMDTHDLFSPEAIALGSAKLREHQLVAEQLLGFHEYTPYQAGTRQYSIALAAIATQVNYMVEVGIEGFVKSQSTRGERSSTFRAGQRRMPIHHPIAKKLAASIAPDTAVVVAR